MAGHDGPVQSAVFSADGGRVLTASDDKTARVWRNFPTTQALIAAARAVVNTWQLTSEQRKRFFLKERPQTD